MLTTFCCSFSQCFQRIARIVLRLGYDTLHPMSRDSSVDIATDYGLEGRGSIPGSARFFSTPQRPDRLWDPPSYPMGAGGDFPGDKATGA
jgi:hypothetical protein